MSLGFLCVSPTFAANILAESPSAIEMRSQAKVARVEMQ